MIHGTGSNTRICPGRMTWTTYSASTSVRGAGCPQQHAATTRAPSAAGVRTAAQLLCRTAPTVALRQNQPIEWRLGSVLRRIRACATAIRTPLPGPRQRQRGVSGLSSRSAASHSATAAMTARCPCETSKGKSISAQHEPTHQTACVNPKRSAPISAAAPKAASSGWTCPWLRQRCLTGEHCQTSAVRATDAISSDDSSGIICITTDTASSVAPAAIQIVA
jgi:hypothetical protein